MIRYINFISVSEYNKLRDSVGWRQIDRQRAEKGLDNSYYTIAAYDEERAVGFARVIGDGGYMYLIADVMVDPQYQGQGIGKAILGYINEWLDSLAQGDLFVMVNLMSTKGNEGFYEKSGFVRRPNDEMGAGMVRWINT